MFKNEKKKPINEVVEYIPNLVQKEKYLENNFRIKNIYIACEN